MKHLLETVPVLAIAVGLISAVVGVANASPELKIVSGKIEGTTVELKVANVTKSSLVDGRLYAYFDNGSGTQERVATLQLKPGESASVSFTFEPGEVSPTSIVEGPDPVGKRIPIGPIILGTITDDINPF